MLPKLRPGQWLCSREILATTIFIRCCRQPESLGAALGHLKAKTQVEPAEIQAGSVVGVDGVILDVEGTLKSLVVFYSLRLWGLTKRLTQGHTLSQWQNWYS